jgi:hypothetical protein
MTAELAFGSAKNGEYFMTSDCPGGGTGFSGHGSAQTSGNFSVWASSSAESLPADVVAVASRAT